MPLEELTHPSTSDVDTSTAAASSSALDLEKCSSSDGQLHVPEPKVDDSQQDLLLSRLTSAAEGSDGNLKRQLSELLKRLAVKDAPEVPKEHKFWNTQPVPGSKSTHSDDPAPGETEKVTDLPFEEDIPLGQIRKEPFTLPQDFEWSLIDLNSAEEKKELYKLLTLNYVEDNDAMFRFDYSAEFLEWALTPPGWKKVWHIGVRVASNKKLVAFISGIPVELMVHNRQMNMVEINFLCIHKKLRSKRLAPVLIKEVTRRVNLEGIFQAVYTAGVVLPTPVAVCRYFHRSLNPKKLLECNFSKPGRDMTMTRYLRRYRLPASTDTPGLRLMEKKDVPVVRTLLNRYLSKFAVRPVFTSDEEAEHWLLHKKDVVWSYVVEDPKTRSITDFVSFYSLPSTVIGNRLHRTLNAAYIFYYATATSLDVVEEPLAIANTSDSEPAVSPLTERLRAIMNDTLILAKNLNFDVFNALELMDSKRFLEQLRFGPGDGNLHYYLFNWRCKAVEDNGIGLMML